MRRFLQFIFSGSIGRTLISIIIFALLLPTTLIVAISFKSMVDNNYSGKVSENQSIIRQISKHFEFYFDNIDSMGMDIYRNTWIYTSLTVPGSNSTITAADKNHFFSNLLIKNADASCLRYKSFVDDYETISSVGITFGGKYSTAPYAKSYYNQFYTLDHEDFSIENAFVLFPAVTEEGRFLVYYRVIYNVYKKQPVGELYIIFRTNFIEEACSFYQTDSRDALALYSLKTGCVIYENDQVTPEMLSAFDDSADSVDEGGGFQKIKLNAEQRLAFYAKVPNYDVIVCKVISEESIRLKFSGAMVLLIAMALLSILIAIVFSQSITRPIKELHEAMRLVQQGEYGRQIPVSNASENEIVQAVQTFNQMTCEIDRLINESLLAQIELQQARLNELQATINPHFISNTLQSISGMATKHNAYDVKYALEIFSNLMRYGINAASPVVPLSAEMEHARKYLILHKLRLGNRLNFTLSAHGTEESLLLPRLTLQPLIENCICHGLDASERTLNISVTAHACKERFILSVCDDGVGFDSAPEELLTSARQHTVHAAGDVCQHIGLSNVLARLKNQFGDRCRMELSSVPFKQTCVSIIIQLAEDTNHEATHC